MSLIDKTPLLAGINYAKGQTLYRLGLRRHRSGSTAAGKSVDEGLRYVNEVFADYILYGGAGDASNIIGKDVLEIGPGDNLGVALLLLAYGAKSVTCIDGFDPHAERDKNSRLYRAIYTSLSEDQQNRLKDIIRIDEKGPVILGGSRLKVKYKTPIDVQKCHLSPNSADIIVSRAVLEHVSDLPTAWKNMVQCLRPHGEMWHKVDLRCHHFFEQIHPLYFLTIPDRWWQLTSQPDPTLNRLRLQTYRELGNRDFERCRIRTTHIIGRTEMRPPVDLLVKDEHWDEREIELVNSIRPRLIDRFKDHAAEDLLVTGIFLSVSVKRSANGYPKTA